ncbi:MULTISPECIES: LLM class flavin-dependent oxidoreductase [Paraliobacillus]|uniref:LLM class flavin-dependent oxidoreductase n=1 Tax=Paraliobacillus TaxID=200903 RepID=UPI000DD49B46|nr:MULTISPECIES: LLM class flavin-dependent oxidoreductase [Paraliobacillus]
MRLSILDQSPLLEQVTSSEALVESVKLAQVAEAYGYHRFWLTEHHGINTLASSAPEVVLSYIGSNTKKIRLGAGAILLPHYKPLKVAETFHTLATLFPDRIDLGIGRAPGGSAQASIALSGNYLENVKQTPDKIRELLHFIKQDFPNDHIYHSVIPMPLPEVQPEIWLLGTSDKSAKLAGDLGIKYAFGEFMSENKGPEITNKYKTNFSENKQAEHAYTLVTVQAICLETEEEASQEAFSHSLNQIESTLNKKIENRSLDQFEERFKQLSPTEQELVHQAKEKIVYGTPKQVKNQLEMIQNNYQADELMIITNTKSYATRLKSFQLIAEAF